MTCQYALYFPALASRSDWFIVLVALVVIGQSSLVLVTLLHEIFVTLRRRENSVTLYRYGITHQ